MTPLSEQNQSMSRAAVPQWSEISAAHIRCCCCVKRAGADHERCIWVTQTGSQCVHRISTVASA